MKTYEPMLVGVAAGGKSTASYTKIIQCVVKYRKGHSFREEEILPLLKLTLKMEGQLNVKQMAHCGN